MQTGIKFLNTSMLSKMGATFKVKNLSLTFTTLWPSSADIKLIIHVFFLFFPENGLRHQHFMEIVPLGNRFDSSGKLSPKETNCMNCQNLLSGKNQKNSLKCCLLKFFPRVLSINQQPLVSKEVNIFMSELFSLVKLSHQDLHCLPSC